MKNYILSTYFALSMAIGSFFFSFVFYFRDKDSVNLIGGLHFAILAYIAAAILKK